MTKILIDAGHYSGYNVSPVHKQYKEGDRMWQLSQYLIAELKAYGFTVGSTKASINAYPKDAKGNDAVDKRGEMAKGYDLMLSLHSNACETESVNRAVIIHSMSGKASAIAARLGECVKSTMGVSSYQVAQRDYNTGAYYYDGKAHSGKDWYGVIRGAASQGVQCLIIEHGFHTNTGVAKWLMSDANLQKLAKAEAKALADHYGVKKPTATTGTQTTTSGVIYRVQVGAYSNKANAEAVLDKLKKAGFDGVITTK